MKITLEIQRYNPETDDQPYLQVFEVEAEAEDRLLSVLMRIKWDQDPGLGLRKSCAHGVCGSDAMVVNGRERLACKTLIKDIASEDGSPIRIEPLLTLPVQRDLMVDQSRFFANYIHVKPFFINPELPPEKERVQSSEERKLIDDGTNCILCGACYSACPVVQDTNPEFLGPAAVVQASRFLDDSRDRGFEERLPQLDYADGIWPCENHFECTRVCPRSIKITKLINLTKRKITQHKA
ncbi:MAG: succinate dehydrogenase iron-sulfur subunit [Candidatus Aminicenantaceae bacterium]